MKSAPHFLFVLTTRVQELGWIYYTPINMKLMLSSNIIEVTDVEMALSFKLKDGSIMGCFPEEFFNYIRIADREGRSTIIINNEGTWILYSQLRKKINDNIRMGEEKIVMYINAISNDEIQMVSLRFSTNNLPGKSYCGLVNRQGKIISTFKYGETLGWYDMNHNRFISNNAIYDGQGHVLCSGFDEIICTFKECNYVCRKRGKFFVFNDENKLNKISSSDSEAGFSEFKHGYTVMWKQLNDNYASNSLINKKGEELCWGDEIVITDINILCKRDKHVDSYSLDDFKYQCTYIWDYKINSLMSAKKVKSYIITEDNKKKYGYVDYPSRQVVPFIYDNVSNEYNDYAIVAINGKKGLIDSEGRMIVKTIYDHILESQTSNILLSNNGGSYDGYNIQGGYFGAFTIDGNIICEPIYSEIKVKDNYLIVKQDDKYGMIDVHGKIVLPIKYNGMSFPHCDLIRVQAEVLKYEGPILNQVRTTKLLWGFVDMSGKIQINPKFSSVRDFHADRAAFYENGYYGFIDKHGFCVIPPIFSNVSDFDEHMKTATVECRNGNERYSTSINIDGTINMEGRVTDSAWDFCNDMRIDTREDKEQEWREMFWDAFEDDPDALWNID